MLVLNSAKSDAQNHRPVTPNDGCKRRLVALPREPLEQFLVGFRAQFKRAYDLPYAAEQTIMRPFFHSRASKLE